MDSEKPPIRLLEAVADHDRTGGDEQESPEALNAVELRFVELIAAGVSYEDAGGQIGKSPRTCRRWAKRPEIKAAVRARALEQVTGARAILAAGMSRAARSLVDMSDGAREALGPKVAAARAVLDCAAAMVSLGDVLNRLEELEALVAARPGLKNQGGTRR